MSLADLVEHAVLQEREACAQLAAEHRPARVKRGKSLKAYDQEDREIIRAEENGEAIAASEIAAAIRARPRP